MKVAYFKAPGEIELRESECPRPQGREVLLRLAAAGLCGSDLADLRGSDTTWHQLGHEYAGFVEATGAEATLAPGAFVAAIGSLPCGQCWYCTQADPVRCPQPRWCGSDGFAEYVCKDESFLLPAPGLTPHEGALLEPLTVAMQLVADGGVGVGASVCVIGMGPIGLMTLALARAAGASRVYAVHPTTGIARIAAAQKLGAEAVFHPDKQEVAASLRELEPRGVDIVLATAPLSKTMAQAVGMASAGGTIAFVGMEWQPEVNLQFGVDWFHFQKMRLIGSNHNPCMRLYPEAVRLVREKVIKASLLVSHSFPLTEIRRAFEQARDRASAIKIMVDCN